MSKPITDEQLAELDSRGANSDSEWILSDDEYAALRERLRLAEQCIEDVEYWKDCVGHYRGCTDAINKYRAATGKGDGG